MVALIAAGAALVGAGADAYSASQAAGANEDALAAEQDRIKALGREIDIARRAADELRDSRPVVSEKFGEILTQYPQLMARILPQLENLSMRSSDRLAEQGSDQFLRLREKIAPGTGELSDAVTRQVRGLDPDKLGQEEIAAITRQLGPLIPAGTLNPQTGAVRGATSSPVSMYRNLISSNYAARQKDFITAGGALVGQNNNAASRQQVSAADFLTGHLNRGTSAALGLAAADAEQVQQDINAQEAFIRLAAGGLQSQYDPSANNALVAQGVSGASEGIAAAASAIAGRGNTQNRKNQLN